MASFVSELRRRDVFRVGAAYAVAAWLLLQVADVVLPTFEASLWVMQAITVILIVGFPLALIFAWLFELTPEGVRPDSGQYRPDLGTRIKRRKIDFAIFGLMAIAILVLVVDRVLMDEVPTASSTDAGVARSIAVLPFDNRSAVAEDAYFVDGIHDDILSQLSRLSAFEKVISRISVEKYRDTTKSMPEIGQELGATTILEGGVQRAGDRVRINVQLIDAATDEHQWAETYERQLTTENIFAIQAEIASAVAEALEGALTAEERSILSVVPTANMAALESYFHGKAALEEGTAKTLREAGRFFQKAIDLDSNFAPAYVGLANVHNLMPYYMGTAWEPDIAVAYPLIMKALELDEGLAEAYAALGLNKTWTDYEEAEQAYRKATELNPNDVIAHARYCDLLNSELGRPAEARRLCEKAFELDPRNTVGAAALAYVYTGLGRYADADIYYRKVLELDPDNASGYADLAWLNLYAYARLDEAVKFMRKSLAIDPEVPTVLTWLGHVYTDLGDGDQAEFWYGQAMRLAPENFESFYGLAMLHTFRGNYTAAVEYSKTAYESAPSLGFALEPPRDQAIKAGRPADARALYEEYYADLLISERPEITSRNFQPAIDLALVLTHTGENERANLLLELVTQHIQTVPRLSSINGFGIADVQIYVILGDTQKALSSLRQVVDEGWRSGWWYFLKHDLNVESIRNEPKFQAIVAELEADMADQLERVRSWEAAGDLAPIPALLQ